MSETAIVPVSSFGLAMVRKPEVILAEAKQAADALKNVISKLPEDKKVMMGGEQYIEVDHWNLIAAFYRCTPKIVSTESTEYGDARGFVARAVLVNEDGREISAADAMCLSDEDNWGFRPKYEWKDGKRTVTGQVPVPANQLRSMAQTRAIAKVCRNVFSWVVVLAGYAPTPAEELTGNEKPPTRQPPAEPKLKAKTDTKNDTVSAVITKTSSKNVNGRDGKTTVYQIHAAGKVYETFEEKWATLADTVAGTSTLADITFTTNEWAAGRFNYNIVDLKVPLEAEAEN